MVTTLNRKAKRMGRFFYGGGAITNITEIANRDHGDLTGLADDDHTQYPTAATFFSRMATVILDSTTAQAGDTEGNVTIQTQADAHRFYEASVRGSAAVQARGPGTVGLTTATAMSDPTCWSIQRASTTTADQLRLSNGNVASVTYTYKVYQLTAT